MHSNSKTKDDQGEEDLCRELVAVVKEQEEPFNIPGVKYVKSTVAANISEISRQLRCKGMSDCKILKCLKDGIEVNIHCTPEALSSIISDGRYKSCFETGKSSANNDRNYFQRRYDFERKLFGPTVEQDVAKSPVYGVANLFHTAGGVKSARDWYGVVRLVIKQGVIKRTTFCYRDSSGCPAEYVGTHEDMRCVIRGFTDLEWSSWNKFANLKVSKRQKGVSTKELPMFMMEAQIHGGLRLDDIEKVILPRKPSLGNNKSLEGDALKLKSLNIKVLWEDDDFPDQLDLKDLPDQLYLKDFPYQLDLKDSPDPGPPGFIDLLDSLNKRKNAQSLATISLQPYIQPLLLISNQLLLPTQQKRKVTEGVVVAGHTTTPCLNNYKNNVESSCAIS